MHLPSSAGIPAAVVIGYGNPLRGDDAVGQRVAATVASWHWPHVRVIAVQQLTPELAELLAAVDLAIFVDASPIVDDGTVQVIRVEPARSVPAMGHVSDPSGLLALAEAIYDQCPLAWWLLLPATSFGFGEDLSPTAEFGLTIALRYIVELINRT